MFSSARTTMPAIDYVSIIRSVYGDRKAMLAGAIASSFAAGLCAYSAQSIALWVVAAAFIVFGLARYLNMKAFARAAIGSEDALAAEHWEHRAVALGALVAGLYGAFCLVSMVLVTSPYAELVSTSLSIAVMVGICARNFGLDRLVAIQMLLVIAPLSLGLMFKGDIYHPVLAILLVVMLSSFRKLAADIRSILLSAVHEREAASRLAQELDMAITTMQHGLFMLDQHGVVTVANERAIEQFKAFGVPKLLGVPFTRVLTQLGKNGTLPQTVVHRLRAMAANGKTGKVMLTLPEERYFEVTVSSGGGRTVLLFEDVSERVASEARIGFMARHDTLTGLPNRSHFGHLVTEDLEARQLDLAHPRIVALMIIDIDQFKHVNDTFGHVVGDRLLVAVASRLREALPPDAILARLGGDEFIVYRGSVGDVDVAHDDSETVLDAFAPVFVLEDVTLAAKVRIGLVTSKLADDTLEDLMTKADLALYAAKNGGMARRQVFHAQMDIDYHYRQRLKADLLEAVNAKGLTLAFQPLLDVKTRRVISCEALARWDHPELGAIPPSVFIPLAEEMGIISAITAGVIEQAALECSHWPLDVGVAVNVSARDFRGADLFKLVDNALNVAQLAASRFEVEVTETAVIEERETAQRVLTQLAERGVSIALDDFGTGYSSLSYLNALPFDKLKIDRSFVVDMATNARALRLMANVAQLGRDLDLTVIAEGIETEEQFALLVAHTQVQQVQGYLFSRPVSSADIRLLIDRLNRPTLRTIDRRHG